MKPRKSLVRSEAKQVKAKVSAERIRTTKEFPLSGLQLAKNIRILSETEAMLIPPEASEFVRRGYSIVQVAKRNGTLIRKPCAECGSPKSLAHHEDYSKPLDVVWLCQKHHLARHKQIGFKLESSIVLPRIRIRMKLATKMVEKIDHRLTGARARSARQKSGKTLRFVACALGFQPSYLSDLECGKRNWNKELLRKFLRALK